MGVFRKENIDKAAGVLRKSCETRPRVGVVLGSGLGGFVKSLAETTCVPYEKIPAMPKPSVEGHSGYWWFGNSGGMDVLVMQGRFHLYEGRDPSEVVIGVRLMAALGIDTVILTNAAGGISHQMSPGDLMLIEDHLNLTGHNCLTGASGKPGEERFVDMTNAYDPKMQKLASQVAEEIPMQLHSGVYAGLLGPSYETPAEVRMLRALGADAVGMSTVLETIAARQLGIRVLGISCITNLAAGVSQGDLSHAEVQEVAKSSGEQFRKLLQGVLVELGRKNR